MQREAVACCCFMFVLTTQYLSQSEPNLTCTSVRLWIPGMSVRNTFSFDKLKSTHLFGVLSQFQCHSNIFCMYFCVGERGRLGDLGGEGRVYICECSAMFSLGCKGLYCECLGTVHVFISGLCLCV